jgi:hypothetical protein
VLRLLLERGAAMDTVAPRQGCTAFHAACFNNQPECVEALARAGCDVGIKDTNGETGRQIAERYGHTAVLERLRARRLERLRAVERQLLARDGPTPEPAVCRHGTPAWQLPEATPATGRHCHFGRNVSNNHRTITVQTPKE